MTIAELRHTHNEEHEEYLTDVELMQRVRRQEREALSILYDRYARLVYSIAYHLVSDHAIAEEIAMDVFIRIWEKASNYQPERAKVTTWMTSITRNHSLDWLRKQKVRRQAATDAKLRQMFEDSSAQHTERDVELSLRQEAVRGALYALPSEQLQVIELAYYKGYAQPEIAAMLQIPIGTVKSRTRLAMEKLRQVLGEHR